MEASTKRKHAGIESSITLMGKYFAPDQAISASMFRGFIFEEKRVDKHRNTYLDFINEMLNESVRDLLEQSHTNSYSITLYQFVREPEQHYLGAMLDRFKRAI